MDLHAQLQQKLLTKDSYLTTPQQEVVTHDGLGVVRACPGSGKTRALAARIAYRMSKWQSQRAGIAALSFTNVAVDELRNGLEELGLQASDAKPHFIGTIDSFIYQHLTGPHLSAIIPDIKSRPEPLLAGQDAWVADVPAFCAEFWMGEGKKKYPHRVPVTRYFMKPDGRVGWHPTRMEERLGLALPSAANVIAMKHNLAKSGYISISDSMYYAHQILHRYPQLAAGLASRYPQIVIDECQDTSDVQHEIISILVATGKTQVLMIGDPYQAIYEFNDANPQLMLDRIEKDGWHEIRLSDNFRSSGRICEAVTGFFSFDGAMDAKGKYQGCQVDPVVLQYPDNDVGDLPSLFSDITEMLAEECAFKEAKIVARTNGAVRELRRLAGEIEHKPSYCTRHLIASATYRDGSMWAEASAEAQSCLCRLVYDRASLGRNREPLGDMPYREWRQIVWAVVSALPLSSKPLTEWIPAARESVRQVLADAGVEPHNRPSARIRCPNKCPNMAAASLTASGGDSDDGQRIDTVHKVKGQTLDGIMLVASPKVGSRKSSVYGWLPSDNGDATTEEQRIAYVAMTRPSKLLVVAVPKSAWKDCGKHFSGFTAVDSNDLSSLQGVCSSCALRGQTTATSDA